jgi:excinuclease ABC subunit B
LRSGTALIQTIGRAARHVQGKVLMYANTMTDSMRQAIDETNRRRAKQARYNEEHGIEPVSIVKAIHDLTDQVAAHAVAEPAASYDALSPVNMPVDELARVIGDLEKGMKAAAEALEFEKAAGLRDQIYDLRSVLAEKQDLPPWRRARVLSGTR